MLCLFFIRSSYRSGYFSYSLIYIEQKSHRVVSMIEKIYSMVCLGHSFLFYTCHIIRMASDLFFMAAVAAGCRGFLLDPKKVIRLPALFLGPFRKAFFHFPCVPTQGKSVFQFYFCLILRAGRMAFSYKGSHGS